MAKSLVIDEVIITFRVPAALPDPAAELARRALAGRAFTAALRAAVRGVAARHPDLAPVRPTVTR